MNRARRPLTAMLVMSVITLAVGCEQKRGVAPASRREALLRVNENLERIAEPIQYNALVSLRFRDDSGAERQLLLQDAALFFKPRQMLRVDMRSPVGVTAQFGSNATRYWLWVDPEIRTLWWGAWAHAGRVASESLPIPPDDLFDALLLRPLPESLEGGLLPLLRVTDDDHRLVYVRLGPDRQPMSYREFVLSPAPPYQPVQILDRAPDGRILMDARLARYEAIGPDGALTPREYVVRWPEREAELRMSVLRVTPRPDLQDDLFAFPESWSGRIENVDATEAPGVQP